MEDQQQPVAEPILITDWVSAVCSAIAAVIALIITLVTVYVAARQLLTEHKAYEMGLSQEALGPWHTIVKTKQLFGLQQTIATPVISVPLLVKRKWHPEFIFPTGFQLSEAPTNPRLSDGSARSRWTTLLQALRLKPRDVSNLYNLIDTEHAPARASWVNFIQALNIQPQDDRFYRMHAQSALVNGIVPMRWVGKDLCSIGSILGFQSYESRPSFNDPMPLPMQWSGPLGWLQFRPSPEGCVVEFRRRARFDNQLSDTLHKYYHKKPRSHESHLLVSRLWWSVNGLALKNGWALILGGADETEPAADTEPQGLEDVEQRNINPDTREGIPVTSDDGRSVELLDGNLTLGPMIQDRGASLPDNTAQRTSRPQASSQNRQGEQRDFELLSPCPRLLSDTNEGELAASRGLDMRKCYEYHRRFVAKMSASDQANFPFSFNYLRMDWALLREVKEAMELLQPDGYYFTPTPMLAADLADIFHTMYVWSSMTQRIFPSFSLDDWPKHYQHKDELHHAMVLCNEFQQWITNGHGHFTVDDMVVIAKASNALRNTIRAPADLSWAMIVCPKFCIDVAQFFEQLTSFGSLNGKVRIQREVLDCTEILTDHVGSQRGNAMRRAPCTYSIPLCGDAEYTGWDLLAAFANLMVTYFWVRKNWITDVARYDHVIPQTIIMC